jgi:hypothetical protein
MESTRTTPPPPPPNAINLKKASKMVEQYKTVTLRGLYSQWHAEDDIAWKQPYVKELLGDLKRFVDMTLVSSSSSSSAASSAAAAASSAAGAAVSAAGAAEASPSTEKTPHQPSCYVYDLEVIDILDRHLKVARHASHLQPAFVALLFEVLDHKRDDDLARCPSGLVTHGYKSQLLSYLLARLLQDPVVDHVIALYRDDERRAELMSHLVLGMDPDTLS